MLAEVLYPKGGWKRAFHYVKHRVRRLPDTPERIARGIWVGVFTTFTPFYGLHFLVAALLATIFRGNILASLMATFFGNPLTYVPIGVISLKTGHLILGTEFREGEHRSFGGKFVDAADDLWENFMAIFSDGVADWHGISVFWHEVFFPYMIGGILPGFVAGGIAYFLSLPLIRAYKNRRRRVLKAKFDAIKKRAEVATDTPPARD